METIKATMEKDKKLLRITYSFSINNENFAAHYIYSTYGKSQRLDFYQNGTQINSIENTNNKVNFEVETDLGLLNFVVWLNNPSFIGQYTGQLKGLGMEVNGKPVQHTLSDPDTQIATGRSGLFILMLILGFKTTWSVFNILRAIDEAAIEYNVDKADFFTFQLISDVAIYVLAYFIPLIIILVLTLNYKKWFMGAIITGVIVSVLEMFDYILGIPDSMNMGTNIASLVFWILIRISVLCLLYNAFKWAKIKIKKQENAIKPLQ